jgi:DNA/RNA endonuclease G (NUC1)
VVEELTEENAESNTDTHKRYLRVDSYNHTNSEDYSKKCQWYANQQKSKKEKEQKGHLASALLHSNSDLAAWAINIHSNTVRMPRRFNSVEWHYLERLTRNLLVVEPESKIYVLSGGINGHFDKKTPVHYQKFYKVICCIMPNGELQIYSFILDRDEVRNV